MVLGLEPQVALDVHENPRPLAPDPAPYRGDVLLDLGELLARICAIKSVLVVGSNTPRQKNGWFGDLPLQPLRMSIPITCFPPGRQDLVFHVLYGGNEASIRSLIDQTAIDIAREYPTDGVREALHRMRPQDSDSLNKLRARFFMLLGESEAMRRRLSAPMSSPGMPSPFCEHRARLFYDELCDDLLPAFVQNQNLRLDQFVDNLREAYLHS